MTSGLWDRAQAIKGGLWNRAFCHKVPNFVVNTLWRTGFCNKLQSLLQNPSRNALTSWTWQQTSIVCFTPRYPSSYLLAPRVLQQTFEVRCKTNFDTLCHPGFATNFKAGCNAQVAMLCHPGFCSKLQKFVAEAKYLVFDTQGFATNFRSSLQN